MSWTVPATAAVVLLGYALLCTVSPFAQCLVCNGTGGRLNRSGRRVRDCWWCRGAKLRIRLGRRAFTAARGERDRAVL